MTTPDEALAPSSVIDIARTVLGGDVVLPDGHRASVLFGDDAPGTVSIEVRVSDAQGIRGLVQWTTAVPPASAARARSFFAAVRRALASMRDETWATWLIDLALLATSLSDEAAFYQAIVDTRARADARGPIEIPAFLRGRGVSEALDRDVLALLWLLHSEEASAIVPAARELATRSSPVVARAALEIVDDWRARREDAGGAYFWDARNVDVQAAAGAVLAPLVGTVEGEALRRRVIACFEAGLLGAAPKRG